MTNQIDTTMTTTTTLELLDLYDVHGYIDKNGIAMLLSDDIARELGYTQSQQKISTTTGGKSEYEFIRWNRINEYLVEYNLPPTGRGQYISEDTVYYLAFKANNEKAKAFHMLLVKKIIPYFKDTINKKQLELMKQQIQEEIQSQNQPALDWYQQAVEADIQTVPLSVIADNYGMTPQALNTTLHRLGFHHPIGDGWVINEQYKDQGLVKTRKGRARNMEGTFDFITGYTEKGRQLIHQLLTSIQPMNQSNIQYIHTMNQYNYPAPPVPGSAPGYGHPIIYNTEQYCPNIRPGTTCPLIFSDPRLNAQFR